MRAKWVALVLVAASIARADEDAASADPRTPTSWRTGEVVSASVLESTDTKMTMKGPAGAGLPAQEFSSKLTAKFVQRCLEADAAGRLVRSLVRVDAWTWERGPGDDHCLEGALVEAGPEGWTLVSSSWNPSRAGRNWLGTRFGGRDARGFAGGLAELGAPGPVAAGASWTAEPPEIALQLVTGSLPVPIAKRPWRYTVAEVRPTPAGPLIKVSFDETFPLSGGGRADGRAFEVAEGSTARGHGFVAGTPGAWHRTGRMEFVSEDDVRTTSQGAELRIESTGRETESWEAGGRTPEMPVAAPGTPAPLALGRGEVWSVGDLCVETGSERSVTVTTPYDRAQAPGESWKKEATVSWTAELACDEVDDGAPSVVLVTFREWTASEEGVLDASLTGAVVRVTGDDTKFARSGATPSSRAKEWVTARFSAGVGDDDPVRSAVTPVMLVAPKQAWWSDPDDTAAALRSRLAYPLEHGSLTGTGTLVRVAGEGAGARAEMDYTIDAGIACVPGCQGAGADLLKGSIRVRGSAAGPVEQWARLGSFEDETEIAVTVPGLGADESVRRLAIRQHRRAARALVPPQTIAARKLSAAASEKLRKRDPDGAIADCTQAIAEDPAHADAWFVRGRAKAAKRDADGAIADFDRAAELAPRASMTYYNRALARNAKGDRDGAFADYTKTIELSPRFGAAWNNRGILHFEKGAWDLAIDDYTQAFEIDPKDAQAVMNRGNAKLVKKDVDGAIEDCTLAVELDPKAVRGPYNLGRALAARGDHDAAIEQFSRAIEIDAAFRPTWNERGRARRTKGDVAGAIEDFTKVTELDPAAAYGWNNRGSAKAELEDLDGAVADWRKAVELDPSFSSAHLNLARAAFRPGRPTAPVVEGLRRAIAVDDDPDYDYLWLWLARARGGEEDAATKELTEYLAKRKPPEDDAWYPVLAGLVGGTVTEEAALAATQTDDEKTTRERLCEAAFFAGMRRALRGDVPGAVALFDRAIATDVRNYTEYGEAKRWRRALLEAPAPK